MDTKFRSFCAGMLTDLQIEDITRVVRDLENVDDVTTDLTPLLLRAAQR